MKKRLYALFAVIAIMFGVFALDFFPVVYAEDSSPTLMNITDLDKSSVNDDLGKDLSIYIDEDTDPDDVSLISLQEYCYSPEFPENTNETVYGDRYYNVYLYFYNPSGYVLESKGDDAVQISGYNYFIKYLNKTSDGLYYKYKIIYKDALYDRMTAYSRLHSGEREYVVEQLFFYVMPNLALPYVDLSVTFTFSGYASGFGGNSTSRLQCVIEDSETLQLEVTPTMYRPAGTSGKNDYTRDMLHSVYFSVPNSYLETYGEMYEVHAEWLNAVTAPALVTGNQTAYNAITPYLGQNIGRHTYF